MKFKIGDEIHYSGDIIAGCVHVIKDIKNNEVLLKLKNKSPTPEQIIYGIIIEEWVPMVTVQSWLTTTNTLIKKKHLRTKLGKILYK